MVETVELLFELAIIYLWKRTEIIWLAGEFYGINLASSI